MENLEMALVAFDVKTVRDAQAALYHLWNDDTRSLTFEEFTELKRILRKLEDYFEKKWNEMGEARQ